MKIFLSWSGNQSHLLAQALEEWIPSVFQSVKCFLSSKDIYAGVQWFPKLKAELEAADFGIVCLTKTNLSAQFIMLESGAIAMKVGDTKLVPVLCDVSEAELGKNPLAAFNYVHLGKKGMWKLAESINSTLEDKFTAEKLKKYFDHWWNDLEPKIKEIVATPDNNTPKKKIDLEDSVEEMLSILRSLARRDDALELVEVNRALLEHVSKGAEPLNALFSDYGSSLITGADRYYRPERYATGADLMEGLNFLKLDDKKKKDPSE